MDIVQVMYKSTAVANILIASADTLIVVKKKKRKAENTWSRSLPKSCFLL